MVDVRVVLKVGCWVVHSVKHWVDLRAVRWVGSWVSHLVQHLVGLPVAVSAVTMAEHLANSSA